MWMTVAEYNLHMVGAQHPVCELTLSHSFDIRKRIQKFSVQLWSVNQRTTEAEEVADS
jgi:hypothetical protein